MQAPGQIRILNVGNDLSVLSSRANLLTQAGYSADLEVDEERAMRRLRARPYHMVVVSNRIGQEEQLRIRAKCKQVKPEVPVLLLDETEDEAEQFLASVASRLRRSKANLSVKPKTIHARHGKRL